MTRIVLGSASTGRLRVLRNAGIDPLVAVSGVDEDAAIAALGADPDPAAVVTTLARAKADAVARELDALVAADCVVIGCDSMLYVDGELRGKPGTPDRLGANGIRWPAGPGNSSPDTASSAYSMRAPSRPKPPRR